MTTIIIFPSKAEADRILGEIQAADDTSENPVLGVDVWPVEYNTADDGRVCIAHAFNAEALKLFAAYPELVICEQLPDGWQNPQLDSPGD